MEWAAMILWMSLCAAPESNSNTPAVLFQAHRGGVDEVPENTLAAYEYAWSISGAVPEVDVAVTSDGVMVCLHDDTPERTTDAPAPWSAMNIERIPFEETRKWDAGVKFSAHYAGERIPTLEEVFGRMKGRPERQVYLDLKNVDLDTLAARIHTYGLEKQIIFVHGTQSMCVKLQALYPGVRTMTWLSGKPEAIRRQFAKYARGKFCGISQLQMHLLPATEAPGITYVLDDAFLAEAVRTTRASGVELQLRPFKFDARSLRHLFDLGVRWYVTDAPKAFSEVVKAATELPGPPSP